VTDYFTPYDQLKLAKNDLDLGSGSGMRVPTQKGKFSDEIITAGKEGLIYVVNRSNKGKFDAQKNRVIETVCGSATGYWGQRGLLEQHSLLFETEDFLSQYASSIGLLSKEPGLSSAHEVRSGQYALRFSQRIGQPSSVGD
jgi:hypothetical protein